MNEKYNNPRVFPRVEYKLVWCLWAEEEATARVDSETGQKFCGKCGGTDHEEVKTDASGG